MAQLVQYGTFPLQNIGFLEGAHPIAAELTTCSLPEAEPRIASCATFPLCSHEKERRRDHALDCPRIQPI